MADKPSRALVLYGDGLARHVEPSHTNIHSLASHSLCGFLSLPNAPQQESEDERIVREFAQLVDACQANLNTDGKCTGNAEFQESTTPTIPERFMGMKAAVVTKNPRLNSFCGKLGLSVFQYDDLIERHDAQSQPQVHVLASGLLELLGFKEGKTLETCQFELVFVHIGAGEKVNSVEAKTVSDDINYIDALAGFLMHTVHSSTEIGSRLHLSLLMSYGSISEEADTSLSVMSVQDDPNLSSIFPRQSYTMRGEKPRDDVRHHCPMLIAQCQHAVTRIDMAKTFSFKEFKEWGGNLVIPADRFLHEVAFKLWKAPKYGA